MVSKVKPLSAHPPAPQERIVQVAERVFLRFGFSRISMDDLARELGMSKKTLYAHFLSKDALVVSMLEYRTGTIERDLRAVVESSKSFAEKFRDLAQLIQARAAEVGPVFLDDIRRFSPAGFEVIERFRARVIPLFLGRLLDEGVREGLIDDRIPRPLLIRMVVLSIQGIVRPEVVAELKIHPASALDHIITVVFGGILTAKGRRARQQWASL